MAINLTNVLSSAVPQLSITKITIEQNKGYFKEINDPHIEAPGERTAEQQTNTPVFVKVEFSVKEKKSTNSNKNLVFKQLKEFIKVGLRFEKNYSRIGLTDNALNAYFGNTYPPGQLKTFSLSDSVSSYEDTDGNIIRQFEIQKEYAANSLPQNLTLVSFVYMEVPDELKNKYNFQKRMFFQPRIDPIFSDGETVKEAFIFRLKNNINSYWTGKIKNENGSLLTDEATPRELEAVRIPNYKIQDFRINSKIEKEKLNFLNINNQISYAKQKQYIRLDAKDKDYFSYVKISRRGRPLTGASSISFSMDYKQLIRDNCLLGNIWENIPQTSLDFLYSESRIIDFKILRRRVKYVNKSSNDVTVENGNWQPFSGVEEVLVSSRQNDANSPIGTLDNLKEIKNVVSSFNDKYRTFHFVDSQIGRVTDGVYQYGVEVEVSDASIKLISRDITQLQNALTKMTSFYHQYVLNENSGGTNFSLSNDEIKNIIALYVRKLENYYNITTFESGLLYIDLDSQVSQYATNSRGTLNFIKLLSQLIDNLRQLISSEIFSFSDPHIEGSVASNNNTNRTFKIKRYFENDFVDTNYRDKKQVNYLPTSQNAGFLFFNELTPQQLKQYFNSINYSVSTAGSQMRIFCEPFVIRYDTASKTKNTERKKYNNDIEFSKKIRQNLLKHVNITVETDLADSEEGKQFKGTFSAPFTNKEEWIEDRRRVDEQNLYRPEINNFYQYCSDKYVKEKEIDEVFDSYPVSKREFITEMIFFGEDGILNVQDIREILATGAEDQRLLDNNSYLFGFFQPVAQDYRNSSWKLSDNMDYTDNFFFIKLTPDNVENLKTLFKELTGTAGIPDELEVTDKRTQSSRLLSSPVSFAERDTNTILAENDPNFG